MRRDRRTRWGAGAGAAGVLLFLAGALVLGGRPAFDAPAAEIATHFAAERTRIQVDCALIAAAVPLLVWFLGTVASLAREFSPRAGQTGLVAYGCGLVFLALFLVDASALAVGALRPERLAEEPGLATLLLDVEFLAIGMAAPLGAAMLAALAVLALRDGALWPRWLGVGAAVAAPLYALRTGTLFTTSGPFAADGVLGLWLPVGAFVGWLLVASVALARSRA